MAVQAETATISLVDQLINQQQSVVGDFASTTKLLTAVMNAIEELKNSYFSTEPPAEPNEWLLPGLVRKYDSAALENEKNKVLESFIIKALELFNSLTKPRKKKHHLVVNEQHTAGDKQLLTQQQSDSDGEVHPGTSVTLVSDHFFDHCLSQGQKAYYHFIRGQLYNLLPNYCELAESNLTQAVKWDPTLIKAWNSLGECVWKRDDLSTARFCFETALNFRRDRETLCRLAMVYRLLGNTDGEKVRFLQQSIAFCKEAVQMDVRNGNSWLVLGNGYLKSFFNVTHDQLTLKKALNAYSQAKTDDSIKHQPDVFHNESIIYEYLDDYQAAFEGYLMVQSLDPTQFFVQDRIKEIFHFFSSVSDAISTKCGVDASRMPSMLTSFSEKLHNSALSYYTPVVFDKIPVNSPFTEHVLFCKIVKESACCSIKRSFIVVDPSGTFFVLNVLNLSAEDKSFLRASDELAILDPVRISIKFSFKQRSKSQSSFELPAIRVENPAKLHVNGYPLPKSALTSIWMSTRCN